MITKLKAFAAAAAVAGAVATTMTVGAASASAAGWTNIWIYTYQTDSQCVSTKDGLNAANHYPDSLDQYYYCGGSNHTALWFRKYAGIPGK